MREAEERKSRRDSGCSQDRIRGEQKKGDKNEKVVNG